MTDTQNCRGPAADLWRYLHTQRTYPGLVSDQKDGRCDLEGKLRQAVDNCWNEHEYRLAFRSNHEIAPYFSIVRIQ